MKTVYHYKDYRLFIQDFFEEKKSEGSFTLEMFSKSAGVKSRSYFKGIIDGSRDLNPDSIFRVAKAMDLDFSEHQYFENLVYENQSVSKEQKQHYHSLMTKLKKLAVVSKTKAAQLLDYPFFLSALTLLSDHKIGISKEKFTSLLKIKSEDAHSFLTKMTEAGILRQDKDLYYYNSTHTVFHDSKDWPLKQKQFLLNQIRSGLSKIEKSYDKSKIYSQVFLGRPESIKTYQQLVLDLLNELANQESEYDSQNTELYQVNLQLFEAL